MFSILHQNLELMKVKALSILDSSVTISISVVGDLMCHSPQFEYSKVGKDSFDFSPVYRNVKNYFDLQILLLEI